MKELPPIHHPEQLSNKTPPVIVWLQDQLINLPEFTVKSKSGFDGNEGDPWTIAPDEEGVVVVRRLDGAFFSLTNNTVTITDPEKGNVEWTQPLIVQKAELFKTPEGKPVPIAGIAIDVYDSEGNSLAFLHQEPGAPPLTNALGKEIHPVLRLPLQASVTKVEKAAEGELPTKDEFLQIAGVLGLLDPQGKLDLSKLGSVVLAMGDANRIKGTVVMGVIVVSPEQLKLTQQLLGERSRIITPYEKVILRLTGLGNPYFYSGVYESLLSHKHPDVWRKVYKRLMEEYAQTHPHAMFGLLDGPNT
ncbi:MAG TPA: hypothetical protein EYP23_01700 [Thermoplasmata archaeon]|nr:hypothetical protein [Thermoplasmata archaeon]